MKRFLLGMLIGAIGATIAERAPAQTTYPTGAANVRAGATVLLACDQAVTACRPASPSAPMFTRPTSGANLATAQVSVGTTAVPVAAARAGRLRIIASLGAANACAFGNSDVTSSTGFAVQPVAGASVTLDTAAALYAVCSSTTTISVIEQF